MKPRGPGLRTQAALADLRAAIVDGALGNDGLLPGERDLSARFAVSRTTLRRLLADLVDEGVLRHRQGVGTFVSRQGMPASGAPPAAEIPPLPPRRLAGFAGEMRAQGLVLETREIARALVRPTPDEAMMLACAAGERIYRLTRLRLLGALPLALESAAVPCRLIGEDAATGGSLYAALAARGHPPQRALQRVQAVAVTEGDAAMLGIAGGSVGVSVRRTAYLADGRCCEFTRSVFPAERYDAMSEVLAPQPSPTETARPATGR